MRCRFAAVGGADGLSGLPDRASSRPCAVETFRAVLAPMMTSAAFKEEAERILSYAPEVVEHERATSVLNATAAVTPEVQEYIKAQIARNNGY